jgi:peroxiredoxin
VNRKDIIIITAGIIAGLGLGLLFFYRENNFGLTYNNDEKTTGRAVDTILATTVTIGTIAPDFELIDLDGNRVRLEEFKGKVVLLNFWATWCLPCKAEMPVLDQQYGKNKSELEVLAVNFDESPHIVQSFISEMGVSFKVLLDPGGSIQSLYRVVGYPTSYIIDKTGIIKIKHIGIMTERQLDKYLDNVGIQQ